MSRSSSATACVGTTMASACFRARLTIAFCHATDIGVSEEGCDQARVSWMVTTIWLPSLMRSWRLSGASRPGACTMPFAVPGATMPSCQAALSSRRGSVVRCRVARPGSFDSMRSIFSFDTAETMPSTSQPAGARAMSSRVSSSE